MLGRLREAPNEVQWSAVGFAVEAPKAKGRNGRRRMGFTMAKVMLDSWRKSILVDGSGDYVPSLLWGLEIGNILTMFRLSKSGETAVACGEGIG